MYSLRVIVITALLVIGLLWIIGIIHSVITEKIDRDIDEELGKMWDEEKKKEVLEMMRELGGDEEE